MYPRPAGMSDDDSEDDDFDGFSFSSPRKRNHHSKVDSKEEKFANRWNSSDSDEKSKRESHIINACRAGQLDVIKEYLEQHDINDFLSTGWTLLLYAALSAQSKIVDYLLAHNANPNKHKDGFTPLMALCHSINTSKIQYEILECLKLLLRAEADVNVKNKQRETALMYACKLQTTEFVLELIKHVNDVNACDCDGKTALSYAVAFNKPDIVKILLEHNADALLKDRHNSTPKSIADAKGFTEISALLTNYEEEVLFPYEIARKTSWKDLFPDFCPKNEEEEFLDEDISEMLYGMGLAVYCKFFRGMNLKTFLQLTEDDLCHLGIDVTVHRKQFLENLQKFHSKEWQVDSIGIVKKSLPYTIYNGVISLANIKRQIGVIASSFQHIKNNLTKAISEDIHPNPVQRMEYEEKLRKTQRTLGILKNEMIHIRKLAQKINKENNIGTPAIFISKSKSKKSKRSDWIIMLSVTLMMGLYLSRTTHVQRLWNSYMIRM